MLVPPVETREVTRVPRLAESRCTQIPIRADCTRHDAQIVPKIRRVSDDSLLLAYSR